MALKLGVVSSVVFVALTVLLLAAGVAGAATIHVPDDYTTIQQAVSNATAGDTIVVADGTYYESVSVDKQLTIRSENGSARCIVDANGSKRVFLLTADGIRLEGLTMRNSSSSFGSGVGIYASGAHLTSNSITHNVYGIDLHGSNSSITSNEMSSNDIDIYVGGSNITITNNTITGSDDAGIYLSHSSNSTVAHNRIMNSSCDGIVLSSSHDNRIISNTLVNGGLRVESSYENAVANNTVNGKPLVYLENETDAVVKDGGQVVLVKCTNITVENITISHVNVGIELASTNASHMVGNTISGGLYGIYLRSSDHNQIAKNYITNSSRYGIYLHASSSNSLTENHLTNSHDEGISLWAGCKSNTISSNELSRSYDGICLYYSSDGNTITNNTITDCEGIGIKLYHSNDSLVKGCSLDSNTRWGVLAEHAKHSTIGDSSINGSKVGVDVWYSEDMSIRGNHITNSSTTGVGFYQSNGTITQNRIEYSRYGIYIERCMGTTTIYLNDLVNNTHGAQSECSTGTWSSPEMAYSYNASAHTSRLGNYWSDYSGTDSNGDGVGETPYTVGLQNDTYPLMQPYAHYLPACTITLRHTVSNAGSPVPFDGSSSCGNLTSYSWHFGDGTNATGAVVSHTYTSYMWNGTAYQPFTVSLTVRDSCGDTSTTTVSVMVYMDGDANGDGIANILDAALVGLHWQATYGSSEYSDGADLNNDDVVSIVDAALVGLHWNERA